jgi:exopolyphosphatase/guanosine-5'-triphosphate,3'-diphosphate pyrophosphatase
VSGLNGPVAAIDCGTNSIRLLVAEPDPATGLLADLDRRMLIVRLGQGVDRTGRLAAEALERTFAACREYAEVIRAHGVPPERILFTATSATRDAENREEFTRGVLDILGVEPQVVTGDEEARLSFVGATRELTADHGLDAPYLVVDIGGGSTEFVLGSTGVEAGRSVDIGCVRLTERHLVADGEAVDPATPDRVAAIVRDVDAALDQAADVVPLDRARTLVGLAGTVTTIAAIAKDLPRYDPDAIHHSRVPLDRVRAITARLVAADHAERAAIPAMHEGRVDVIVAGALILQRIMERTGAEDVVVSEHDILDGIAYKAAEA